MSTDLPTAVAEALTRVQDARVRRHADVPGPIRSPADFAAALGYAPGRIAKTLLVADRSAPSARRLHAPRTHYAGATLSADRKLDMKAAARAMGWGGCEVASAEELEAVTGFPRLGVSPLGLAVPVLVDAGLMDHETILIGGGAPGVEIELSPQALMQAAEASIAELNRPA